jgi:hypothetical protein
MPASEEVGSRLNRKQVKFWGKVLHNYLYSMMQGLGTWLCFNFHRSWILEETATLYCSSLHPKYVRKCE